MLTVSKKSGLFASISLRSFLCNVTSENLVHEASKALPTILESFYVIAEPGDIAESWHSFVHEGQRCDINETLSRIIGQMVRTTKKELQNVLCLGYKRISADSKEAKMRDSLDIGTTHINSVISFLRTDEWKKFTQIFGESCLRRLLERCVFYRSINRSFLQISGIPVHQRVFDQKKPSLATIQRFDIFYNTKRYSDSPLKKLSKSSTQELFSEIFGKMDLSEAASEYASKIVEKIEQNLKQVNCSLAESLYLRQPLRKVEEVGEGEEEIRAGKKRRRGCRGGKRVKQRLNNTTNNNQPSQLTAANQYDTFSSIPYAQTTSIHSASASFKQQLVSASTATATSTAAATKVSVGELIINTICNNAALDHSFKTQESTPLILTGPRAPTSTTGNQSNNNSAQKSKAQRVRERRKWMKLLHQKKVPRITASLKAAAAPENEEDASSAMLKNNGRSFHIERTFSAVSSPTKKPTSHVAASSSTPSNNNIEDRSKEIWEQSTSKDQVCAYLLAICRRLLPSVDIWGSRHNANVFYKSVHAFVHLGRYETITPTQLLHGMRLADLSRTTTDTALQHDDISAIMHRLMNWIFNKILVLLIANSFYVTEVEGHGMNIYYFRKNTWQHIVQAHMNTLGDHFVAIDVPQNSNTLSSSGSSPRAVAATLSQGVNGASFSRTNSNNNNNSNNASAAIAYYTSTNTATASAETAAVATAAAAVMGSNNHNSTSSSSSLSMIQQSATKRGSSILFNATLPAKANQPIDPHASRTAERSIAVATQSSLDRTTSNISSTSTTIKRVGSNSNSSMIHFPKLRFVPKKRTLRPIANLKTRHYPSRYSNNAHSTPSIITNKDLYNCLHVLKHIYDNDEHLRGFGAFGNDDIYQELRGYRTLLQASRLTQILPKFYIAAVDLEKCYDHVNTSILYDLVASILTGHENIGTTNTTTTGFEPTLKHMEAHMHGESFIQKYSVTHKMMSMDRVFTKNIRYVTMNGNFIPFHEAGKEIAGNYHNSIISDAVTYNQTNAKEILKLLKQHLFAHGLKMPSTALDPLHLSPYCTQIKGIPQGSILSPILCNLYYGHVEQVFFGHEEEIQLLGLHDKSMIIRLMDDYLMVSTERLCVEHFLQTTLHSYQHYGGRINPLKTKVNFVAQFKVNGEDITIKPNLDNGEYIDWCGMRINGQTLEVEPDISRLLKQPIASSLRVECVHPGIALKRAVKTFFRAKCHALFIDDHLNCIETVLKSLYRLFLLSACRTVEYIRTLRRLHAVTFRPHYLMKCIRQGILFASRLIHTRTERKILRKLRLSSGQWEDDEEDYNEDDHKRILIRHAKKQKITQFGHCSITLQQAMYLGWKAFRDVLAMHKQRNSTGNDLLLIGAVIRQVERVSCIIEDEKWMVKAKHAMSLARPLLREVIF